MSHVQREKGTYPLVSILLLTYNGQRFISEMLQSLLDQRYSNIEIVVSDDASTDRTVQIVSNFIQSRPEVSIKLIQNSRNLGIKNNLIKAFCYSSGALLCLADQDDVWNSNKVEILVSNFLSSGSHYLISDMDIIDSNSQRLPGSWKNYCLQQGIPESHFMNGCATMVSREFLSTCLPIPAGKSHDSWLAICARTLKTRHFVDQSLMKYRISAQGLSSAYHLEYFSTVESLTRITKHKNSTVRKSKLRTLIKSDVPIALISLKFRMFLHLLLVRLKWLRHRKIRSENPKVEVS